MESKWSLRWAWDFVTALCISYKHTKCLVASHKAFLTRAAKTSLVSHWTRALVAWVRVVLWPATQPQPPGFLWLSCSVYYARLSVCSETGLHWSQFTAPCVADDTPWDLTNRWYLTPWEWDWAVFFSLDQDNIMIDRNAEAFPKRPVFLKQFQCVSFFYVLEEAAAVTLLFSLVSPLRQCCYVPVSQLHKESAGEHLMWSQHCHFCSLDNATFYSTGMECFWREQHL